MVSSTLSGDGGKVGKVGRMVMEIVWFLRLPFLETTVDSQQDRPRALIESKLDEITNR